MPKTGFATGYDPALSVRDMARLAAQVESRGYDMFFFSEALLCNRDSVTAMTAFGLATTTIALGCTQVVRLRSPLVMAQTLASLDELTGGRVVLAPGACTDKHARRHGLVPFTPAVSLREWIETIRRILAGERLTYRGQSVEQVNACCLGPGVLGLPGGEFGYRFEFREPRWQQVVDPAPHASR